MIVEQNIANWSGLLNELGINLIHVTNDNFRKLNYWIHKNIKSDFNSNNLRDIQSITEAYFHLNQYDDLMDIDTNDKHGYKVIHQAAKLGFDIFIEKAFEQHDDNIELIINCQTQYGNTPLHLAALKENIAALEVLLEYGADPNISNGSNKLAIHLACTDENYDIAKAMIHLLLPHIHSEYLYNKDNAGIYLVHRMVKYDDVALINDGLSKDESLKNLLDNQGQNILHYAIIRSRENLISHLLQDGSLRQAITKNNSTVLHLAARYASPSVIETILKYPDCQEEKFLNVRDEHGNTALHYLAQRLETQYLTDRLIHLNAKLDILNEEGKTPLGLKTPGVAL